MDRKMGHAAERRDNLKAVLLFITFALVLMAAIGAVFIYLNKRENDFLPDSAPPPPIEKK